MKLGTPLILFIPLILFKIDKKHAIFKFHKYVRVQRIQHKKRKHTILFQLDSHCTHACTGDSRVDTHDKTSLTKSADQEGSIELLICRIQFNWAQFDRF